MVTESLGDSEEAPTSQPSDSDFAVIPKLLSHRLRGFDRFEHTAAAMHDAAGSLASRLEIDTRASRDGVLYIHHDPVTRALSRRLIIAETEAAELDQLRYPNGQKLLRLEEALAIFRARKAPGQRIALDIKDCGFEDEHIRLVAKAGLESAADFVSWIPQSLIRIYEAAPHFPLILSHINTLSWGCSGKLVVQMMRRSIRRLGRYVLIGHERCPDALGSLSHGFQHALLAGRMPESLVDMLAATRGGICVHRTQAKLPLRRYCRDLGLSLWVFSASRPSDFAEWAECDEVDVVFCDVAPAICRAPEDTDDRLKESGG